MIAFDTPWLLCLLLLAGLPWLRRPGGRIANAWIAWAPRDALSGAIHYGLIAAASLAIAALVIGLAGPHLPEYPVERIGRGAEIVLVLDRSRSMDQGFGGRPAAGAGAPRGTGPEAIDYYMKLSASRNRESKGQVARQLLGEFASRRPEDRFSLIVFSTLPIPVMPFTQKADVVQAAIAAGNVGRGLSETNIGLALEAALLSFEGRPYSGSRLVMLVSDGGDRLDVDMRERVAHLVRRERASIDWIYLRSANSPGLTPQPGDSPDAADSVPELFLHRYFQSLPTTYRAYEAGDPEALRRAIEDVSRLENLPIAQIDLMPRRDLEPWCNALAFACVLTMLAAKLMEMKRWA